MIGNSRIGSRSNRSFVLPSGLHRSKTKFCNRFANAVRYCTLRNSLDLVVIGGFDIGSNGTQIVPGWLRTSRVFC